MNKEILHKPLYEKDLAQDQRISPSTLAWLTTGHLTEALRKAYGRHHFSVLSEAWQSLLFFESFLLKKYNDKEPAWIRSSVHTDAGHPLVYARVVVPQETFNQHREQLINLKDQTIGSTLLFNCRDVIRDPFIYFCVKDESDFLLFEDQDFKSLWIRASVFYWQEKPLLITEIFSDMLFPNSDIKKTVATEPGAPG